MEKKIVIRQLQEGDWLILRDIRLNALQTDPLCFGSTYAQEVTKTGEMWREQLAFPDGAIFGLFDETHPVGMTGVALDRADPTRKTVVLWGSWIEPAYRGRALSKLFYEARIEWARAHPEAEKILISHRASNIASRAANRKFGFQKTHEVMKTWPDGQTEPEIFYKLDV